MHACIHTYETVVGNNSNNKALTYSPFYIASFGFTHDVP